MIRSFLPDNTNYYYYYYYYYSYFYYYYYYYYYYYSRMMQIDVRQNPHTPNKEPIITNILSIGSSFLLVTIVLFILQYSIMQNLYSHSIKILI